MLITFKDYMDDFGLNREGAERKLGKEDIFLKDLNPIAPEYNKQIYS